MYVCMYGQVARLAPRQHVCHTIYAGWAYTQARKEADDLEFQWEINSSGCANLVVWPLVTCERIHKVRVSSCAVTLR